MPRNAADPNETQNLLPSLRQYFRTLGTEDGREDDIHVSADRRVYAPVPVANFWLDTSAAMSECSGMPLPMSVVDNSLDPMANHTAPVQPTITNFRPGTPVTIAAPTAAPIPMSVDNSPDRIVNYPRPNPPAIGNSRADAPSSISEPSTTPAPMSAVNNNLDRVANHSAPVRICTPRGLPMSREVSLYEGLPNGWQFRHENISAARDEFILRLANWDTLALGAPIVRPRIPSIAPMTRALTATLITDNCMPPALQPRGVDAELNLSPSSPPPLIFQPNVRTGPQDPDTSQIDPALLSQTSPVKPASSDADTKTRPPPPPSIVRAAAPPSINLESLSSQKTIQAFFTLRDTSNLSPGSPQPLQPLVSPTDSDSSHLSAFPMSVMDSVSPTNTVLLTPVDEVGPGIVMGLGEKVAMELAEKASSLMLNMSTEAVCDHGAGVMGL